MADRERKRAERRKRKARSAAAEPEPDAAAADAVAGGETNPVARGYARAEARNQAAREALEPLAEDERPGAVTAGAIFAGLIALIFWVSAGVAAFTNATVNGKPPSPAPLAFFAFLMTLMAIGMWRARYWAVLGFQMLLVLFLLAAVAGILSATTLLQFAGTLVLIAVCGTFFYKMVRAMARIQMPQRPTP